MFNIRFCLFFSYFREDMPIDMRSIQSTSLQQCDSSDTLAPEYNIDDSSEAIDHDFTTEINWLNNIELYGIV